ATTWKRWPRTLTLRDGRIFLFDSAIEGAADPAAIPVDDTSVLLARPGPGTYAIWTATDEAQNDDIKLTRV
ncbi:MAG TPA: hypothetical protein VHS09_11960, partial [Polyangiaceae bacterium]|nr:hypothetical protein [Polyangiaceae bacterium]